MKYKKIKVTLTDDMLGMSAANPEIYRDFIASKAPDSDDAQEEIEKLSVNELVEKTMTIFPRDDSGNPFLWDYQFRGFLKGSLGALVEFDPITIGGRKEKDPQTGKTKTKGGSKISKYTYKRFVDQQIFVFPREIKFSLPDDSNGETCSRPLRAETMQGPRIALSHSESVPEGTTFEVTIKYHDRLEDILIQLLDYGADNGIGQWHNSGKGRFVWEEKKWSRSDESGDGQEPK